jgi:PAS domain S-box-containing protein
MPASSKSTSRTAELDLEEQLRERVKELRCLDQLGQLLEQERPIDSLLSSVVTLIPPACQVPELAVARLSYRDWSFQTGPLEQCLSLYRAQLGSEDGLGWLEVGYLEQMPFLPEEQQLLDMVCRRLSQFVSRLESERALQLSEQRYRLLADNTLDLIWAVSSDLKFTYVNAAVTRLLGYTPEEVLGSSLQDHCSPATMEGIRAVILTAVASHKPGQGIIRELELYHRDGHLVPMEAHARVLYDENCRPIGFQGTSRDISKRRRTLAALKEREEQFRNMFETMAQGVVFQDSSGFITGANPAAERILGLSLEELQGRTSDDPCWTALREDGSPMPAEEHPSMIALHQGREVRDVLMAVRNAQEEAHRWIKISAAPRLRHPLPGLLRLRGCDRPTSGRGRMAGRRSGKRPPAGKHQRLLLQPGRQPLLHLRQRSR